ncbi:MAG: hypothetical protein IJU83_02685 [Clostridia bacterium]|nr:hypothetical protein [Clostridia bacterium]
MTKKRLSSKLKSIIAILSVLCLFCTCAFFAACGAANEQETVEKTYSYTEQDTDVISNAKFALGTYNKTFSDMPISSPSGWTRAVDNSAVSSNVDSGVISTADEAWTKVFDKLYSDSDFSGFLKNKFEDQAIAHYRTEKGDPEYTPTDDEKKDFYKTEFTNPSTRAEAADADDKATESFVYMLNNYSTSLYGLGSAQRIRSGSTVSVKKGEIYEISVWVKTLIFNGEGANIRIANVVNGNSQAEFRVNGIKDTAWTKYTVYFVASADYDCTFTVMLGLGYGNGDANATQDYVEGTVFFDDVSVNKIDETALAAATIADDKTVVIGAKDTLDVISTAVRDVEGKGDAFKLDANFATGTFFTDLAAASVSGALTVSNAGGLTSEDITGETGTASFDAATGVATLSKNAAYTLTIKDGASNFSVNTADEDNYEKFTLISFKIKNGLNKLGSTDIAVDVIDAFGGAETKRAAQATFSTPSDDFELCNIFVRNNFKNENREFYINIVIGPADVKNVSAASDFAKGTVTISDIKKAEGYISSEQYAPLKADDPLYKLYSFYNGDADATVALYTGYSSDFTDHDHSATYSLNPAKGAIGQITSHPSAVNGYSGIIAEHAYVKGEDNGSALTTVINDRLDFAGANGYAGLINTKYMPAYAAGDANLAAVLNGLYTADKDIQPIVINNKVADHYGFIGASNTVAASAYAKVSVTARAFDDAKAYIYLVDTSKQEKEIMSFADFTVNTDVVSGVANGTTYTAADHKFALTIDKNSAVNDDGWVEINFYLATGTNAKSFRVEVWNGGRDGAAETASLGYVAINSITVSTSSAFNEPAKWQTAFSSSGNPLFNVTKLGFSGEGNELIAYTRELTDNEKSYNKEYPKDAVSYDPTYVWASNATTVYAVFNTVEPVISNPYDNLPQDEEGAGCKATSDPSTFWLSFSSILLAVVLIAAIIALFVKRYAARRKARKSDAVAQYKVKSRSESQKEIMKAKEKQAKKAAASVEPETAKPAEELPAEPETEGDAETVSDNAENGDATEENGYVYGEVQDFGDMTLEMPENESEKKDGE